MKTPITYTVAFILALALMSSVTAQTMAASAQQSGPTNWVVRVGSGSGMSLADMDTMHTMLGMSGGNMAAMAGMMGDWDLMRFYPASITVDAGDTVDWKLTSLEPHNIIFLAPGQKLPDFVIPEGGNSQRLIVNPIVATQQGGATYDGTSMAGSGVLGGARQAPTEYKLTFTKPGTYSYVCAIHSATLPNGQIVGMLGKVVVQATGAAYPQTQAQIDDAIKAQLVADNKEVATAEGVARKPIADRPGPNGTTIHTISVGYNTPDGVGDFMRFAPANITIHAGDTVEWQQNAAQTPHIISLYSGGKEDDTFLIEPQQAGPPRIILNPAIVAPAGDQTYSGKGHFNSGLLNGVMNPAPGPRTYTLKFGTPGTYEYICSLHDQMGMSGHITVLAATVADPPLMPQTGSGAADSFGWLLALAGGLLLIVGGLLLRRRIVVLVR